MQTETQSSELLSITEVANLLHVDPRTVRNRIRQGLLPARTLTGSRIVRVARADVLAQLEPASDASLANPLVDRLATPEGVTRALAALDAPTEGDEAEQRETLALLTQAEREYPISLRGSQTLQTGAGA